MEYFKQKSVTSHATHLSTLGILNYRAVVSDRYPPTVDVPRLSRGSTTFGYLLKFIFYFLIPEQFLGYLNEIATKFHRKWTIIFFQILLDLFFFFFLSLATRWPGREVWWKERSVTSFKQKLGKKMCRCIDSIKL